MKIKLVFPPNNYSFRKEDVPPIGMAKVAGLLRFKGHYVEQDDLNVKAVDFNQRKIFNKFSIKLYLLNEKERILDYLEGRTLDKEIDQLVNRTLKLTTYKNFDLVGFSMLFTKQLWSSVLLAKKIREETNSEIIFGGLALTLVKGLKNHNLKLIDNIIKDSEENMIVKDLTPELLDAQIPDFDGLPLKLYKHRYFGNKFALASKLDKGCVYKCSFCIYSVVEDLETMQPDSVVKELITLKGKYKTNLFDFGTCTANNSYKKLEELCDLIIDRRLNIKWISYASPSNLDSKLLSKMSDSGCYLLKYGIESGSDRLLKLMRKPFTVKKASEILHLSHKQGIMNRVCLIAGYPHETKEDVGMTINFIKKHKKEIDLVKLTKFNLQYLSPMQLNPELNGIKNLKPLTEGYYSFDEINGLKWRDKNKQIEWSYRQLEKAAYYNVARNSNFYHMPFKKIIPFGIQNKINNSVKNLHLTNILWNKRYLKRYHKAIT